MTHVYHEGNEVTKRLTNCDITLAEFSWWRSPLEFLVSVVHRAIIIFVLDFDVIHSSPCIDSFIFCQIIDGVRFSMSP